MEVIITATIDELENYKSGVRKYKQFAILSTCIFVMLCGLPLVTQVRLIKFSLRVVIIREP